MSESAPSRPLLHRLPETTPGLTLPSGYYLDEDIFAAELDTVFSNGWLFAGHTCELKQAGDYFLFSLGEDSVIIVRDEAGNIRAHHNVCRHRGSRICEQSRGNVRVFVCPYHQWTYGVDGRLLAARLMGENFAKDGHELSPVAVREVAGLIFLSLASDPPPFAPAADSINAQLGAHHLEAARIAHRAQYRVAANWKTLVENNRECYHCRGNHPEFLESNFEFGTHGDPRRSDRYAGAVAAAYARWSAQGLAPADVSFPDGQWYRVVRLPLRDGFQTETLDGGPVAPPMGELGPDPGSLRLITLPTMWAHANLDYAVTSRLTPISPSATDVEVCFLVNADAEDIDLDRLTRVWTATSEQDWQLCEMNYAGIRSRAYRPGPLSSLVENSVQHFLAWYLDRLTQRPDGA